MALFDFLKRRRVPLAPLLEPEIEQKRLNWTGNDFEFLIRFADDKEPQLKQEEYDRVMTPNTFQWTKTMKDDYPMYCVGDDSYYYSWEIPGVQMIFNDSISFIKAHKLAYEIVNNLRAIGSDAYLFVIDHNDPRPIQFL
jgi:hypothetical protein